MSVLSSEEFTGPIVKVDFQRGEIVFRSWKQLFLQVRGGGGGGGGGLVHCPGPDNFILFNFCKQILQILYTFNFTDLPLNSSYCRHICNCSF